MKKKNGLPSPLERLGDILNPNKIDFIEAHAGYNYGVETLINGNVSECVRYLKELIGTGMAGIEEAHEQLMQIKQSCPDRYDYVKENVFSIK